VLLSSTNLAAHHFQRREHKFRPAFIGPFKITEQVTDYTYRLDLPRKFRRLYPIFHAALLKRCKGGQREDDSGEQEETMAKKAEKEEVTLDTTAGGEETTAKMRRKMAETKEVALNTTTGEVETAAKMRWKKAETKEVALNTTTGEEETRAKMQRKKAETKGVALNTTTGEEETTAKMRKKKAETKEVTLNTTQDEATTAKIEAKEDQGRRTLEPSAELQRLLGIAISNTKGLKEPAAKEDEECTTKDDIFYFQEVLDRKPTRKKGIFKYLIRWQGFDEQDDSWVTKKEALGEEAKQMLRNFDKGCKKLQGKD
jgi:hypothetical protein